MMRLFLLFTQRLVISMLALLLVWFCGYVWFVAQIPTRASEDTSETDAIVVLTGGRGRIDYGLSLLAEGKAKRLFISGVGEEATPEDVIRAAVKGAQGRFPNISDSVIILGYDATSTIGNAQETAQWMGREGFRSLRLVTANYHMPRSLREFHEAMPDVAIIPDPVMPEGFDVQQWWNLRGSGRVMLSEYHKLLAARIRHVLLAISGEK